MLRHINLKLSQPQQLCFDDQKNETSNVTSDARLTHRNTDPAASVGIK